MPSPSGSPRVRRHHAPTSLSIPTSPTPLKPAVAVSKRTTVPSSPPSSSSLAVVVSSVIVVLLALELLADPDDTLQWRFWIVTLVFPSRQITWIKLAGVTLGIVLSVCYFVSSRAQLASAEQLMIHSATALVSPLRRSEAGKKAATAPLPRTPTGSWFAARCQRFLHSEHSGTSRGARDQEHDDAEVPQLQIVDESQSVSQPPTGVSSRRQQVNARRPFSFESEYFQGQGLILVRDPSPSASLSSRWSSLFAGKRRTLWVQLQGRFTRMPPSPSTLYLATELPQPDGFQAAFLTRQVVALLITLVKKFVPSTHVAFGDRRGPDSLASELPHAAFPWFQTVDELVVTSDGDSRLRPSLGCESFGETTEQRRTRMATPLGHEPAIRLDATYSFQFHTMYADLAQWKIVNVPGMPDMDLKRFCGSLPIRLAAYYVTRPSGTSAAAASGPHHVQDKAYVFCFAMHHASCKNAGQQQRLQAPLRAAERAAAALLSPTVLSPRSTVSCPISTVDSLHAVQDTTVPQPRIRAPSTVRKMSPLERAHDLANWAFSLPLWVERVDPAAGNRKVAYLFVVRPRHSADARPRVVLRSAATVKSALFMLDVDTPSSLASQFKRLTVESREYLYETIARETQDVADILQTLAERPTASSDAMTQQQQSMLYNCLMSEAQLPVLRSFQDIGVQLTSARRDALDIVLESGSYRLLDRRMLRQEWAMLTTSELLCFRSYTLRPCVSVPIAHVLHVGPIDHVPFVPAWSCSVAIGNDEAQHQHQQWFGIEVHTLTRVLTFFVASAEIRTQWLSSLRQLRTLKAARSSSLPAPLSLDSLSSAMVTLNHRSCLETWRDRETAAVDDDGCMRLQVALRRGLALFGRPRDELSSAQVLAFLDAVESLNGLTLEQWPPRPQETRAASQQATMTEGNDDDDDDEEEDGDRDVQRMAFALNAYHVLVIYAWLVYGDVSTHAQWRKARGLLCLAFGDAVRPERLVRISMADLEHGLLRGQPGPGEPTGDATRWPPALVVRRRDFRASLALQLNARQCQSPDRSIARVFAVTATRDDDEKIRQRHAFERTLNDACAQFLAQEVVIDDSHRVIWLPRVCEWNAEDYRPQGAVATGSRAFYCLQQLLPLLDAEQHARVQHLLLGADKECRIKFAKLWTQENPKSSSSAWSRPVVRVAVDSADAQSSTPEKPPSTPKDHDAVPAAPAMPRSQSRLGLDRLQALFQ